MIRFSPVAIATALTLAGLAVASPASAQRGTMAATVSSSIKVARIAPRACAPALLASRECSQHQARILRVVAGQAGATGDHAAMQELGRRQLDALIDSIN